MSIAIPRRVLIATTAAAPPFSAALPMDFISVTFGVSFTQTGTSTASHTAAVIASTVQLVEMFIKKASPTLFRQLGIFLPLITTNCAILGLALFQTNKGYGFVQSIVYALGAGAGFTLALILMAGIREKLELATVPQVVQGTAITLMIAGILSLSFMGFAGLGA